MALNATDIYKQHLAKAILAKKQPNLTPAQKAKLTKRIKRLEQQLEWAKEDNQIA